MMTVTLNKISKRYESGGGQVHALKNIDLELREGEFAALCGPSGSGKSSLLNIIGCLDKPTSGTATILGRSIASMTDGALADLRSQSIGFIFQSFNLIPVLSVYENIEYPLLLTRTATAERKTRVTHMIESLGLDGMANRRPAQLSGGQQQRVAVGRALVTRPKLVLADEPTGNLDSTTGLKIIELMRSLRDQHGTTLLFSTHDPNLLIYPDRIYRMSDGLMTQDKEVTANVATVS